VTSVDHASGKLTLRTVDGQLSATFPPDAAQHITQGDHVTQETECDGPGLDRLVDALIAAPAPHPWRHAGPMTPVPSRARAFYPVSAPDSAAVRRVGLESTP